MAVHFLFWFCIALSFLTWVFIIQERQQHSDPAVWIKLKGVWTVVMLGCLILAFAVIVLMWRM